jgi:magnesium transporter
LFRAVPGHPTLVEGDTIEPPGEGWVWVDLESPSPAELEAAIQALGVDRHEVESVLNEPPFPKVEEYDQYLSVVLHVLVAGEGSRLTTTELGMLIGERFLLTIHRDPVAAVDVVVGSAASSPYLGGGSPARVAATIAEAGTRRYLPLLVALDQRIEDVEDAAIGADPRSIGESQALRRDVIVLRRALGPQRDALMELGFSRSPFIDDEAHRAFLDVYDHSVRLVESLDAARALLTSSMETYRSAVAERTNEVMKLLTVYAAILLPLGLIAGVWGMNFAQLPGSQWRWGFAALIVSMGLIGAGLWAYFVYRGIVGGPRLLELPKALGLGLVHLGGAPIKVASQELRRLSAAAGSGADVEGRGEE